jgi:hypothetical protein
MFGTIIASFLLIAFIFYYKGEEKGIKEEDSRQF